VKAYLSIDWVCVQMLFFVRTIVSFIYKPHNVSLVKSEKLFENKILKVTPIDHQ
jgi:hypothetical protein